MISPGNPSQQPTLVNGPLLQAYAVDQRIKELGRLENYQKELARITKSKKLPARRGFTGPTVLRCASGCAEVASLLSI